MSDCAEAERGRPELSVVIPVYNEAEILQSSVRQLVADLDRLTADFEVILAENGSSDETVALGASLGLEEPRVQMFSHPAPNYGGALREGIMRAAGRFVVCEEIDLCDADFHGRALTLLREDAADLVVGSKAMTGANDSRPVFRRFATRVYNAMLRVTLGFKGTDTHGLKAFQRDRLLAVVESCLVEHDVFASEFVIRAQRVNHRVVEIPIQIEEKRAPSVGLARRVPKVLRNLGQLMVAIHGAPARTADEGRPLVTAAHPEEEDA
jgi:glycosyltransferase involved in cell wall biosynthesis